jgi:ubiquinone/menaquinone biosynthesis C-methylase UbiE
MRLLTLLIACLIAIAAPAAAQHKHGEGKSGGHHSHRFDDPEKWAKSFDNPERDEWQKPDEVIRALALKPDARVADIGAGTGYFTIRLAKSVSAGKVLAVDVEHKMVAYLAERAKKEGLSNVVAVRGDEKSANLPEAVDLALLVNSFHHIDARVTYMKSMAQSLRPGGRVAIIEYRPDATRGAPKHMRMSVAQIDKDMKAAGFTRVETHEFLPHQSLVVYRAIGN